MCRSKKLPTQFAPAERAPEHEVASQSVSVAQAPEFTHLLDSVPDVAAILNRERQIIYCNERLLEFLDIGSPDLLLGQRPGEAMGCIHSRDTAGGCGTTEQCSTCGLVLAILASHEQPGRQVRECRLTREGPRGTESVEFSVWTNQVEVRGRRFTLLCAMDISDRKRRRALERAFFHDIRNTAGNLLNCLELAGLGSREDDAFIKLTYTLAQQILAQIDAQQQLAAAERGELVVKLARIDAAEFVRDLVREYRSDESAKGKEIVIEALPAEMKSDPVLLRRVLGNTLKNALEACHPGDRVTVGLQVRGDRIRFRVNNPGLMPREVQLQVFQRSFSTKAADRGTGTYSMKLLTERYLQGNMWFTSSEDDGTTFGAEFPLSLPQTD